MLRFVLVIFRAFPKTVGTARHGRDWPRKKGPDVLFGVPPGQFTDAC